MSGSDWRLRPKPLLQVAKAESEARFTDPGSDSDSRKKERFRYYEIKYILWRNWQKSINTHHITCPQKNSLQNWIFARLPSVPVIKNIFEIIYVNEKSLLSLTPNFPLCRRDYLPAWVVIIISGRYVFLCCWRIYCRFAKSPTQIDIQRIQLQ